MISRPQLAQVAGQRASDLVSSRLVSPKSATWQAPDLRASSQRPGELATCEPAASNLPPLSLDLK
ncbi:UNVERIFIED_CONTAM: hypothetical protein Slati_0853000 [Sesamum latifolium]|uniref:Uncharacterized protein n=1 Tax=Sesamum latifolium TaxID=2727402 RepID=A0AAW2XNH8_9LAMI